ncbi:FGGY family carbohydrate kinase [Phormidium yuhuli]|uniref:FGGY family carbohydrate kinase n=1 Tax=Phormidium yuhuli TaxID=2974039 RepID=UPI0035A83011
MTSDKRYVLALDLGTTGNRAILFDRDGEVVGQSYKELKQYYPEPGWLEHDAVEIWQDTLGCAEDVLDEADVSAKEVAAIGSTVQRETCLLWDKNTGRPLWCGPCWKRSPSPIGGGVTPPMGDGGSLSDPGCARSRWGHESANAIAGGLARG